MGAARTMIGAEDEGTVLVMLALWQCNAAMRAVVPFCLVLILPACSEWPETATAPLGASAAWPEIVPLSSLATPKATDDAEESDAMERRVAALRARAALMQRAVPDTDAMERLRERLGGL
ncbi:MAG: hypothetical protein AAF762_07445 [Pseudomonadota bacterium]